MKNRTGKKIYCRYLISGWFAACIGLPLGLLNEGHAQALKQKTIDLPQVVVTATRSGEDPLELPYTVDSITGEEIQGRTLSRTTPEILKETSAVMVQKTAHGQGSPFIRGFTGFRTLFLIEGIRLNNSVYRDGPNQYWNTVDPFTIGRLEVIKGPSSVLYGSDAVGGTVNAITLSPFDVPSDRSAGGRAYYRYSTAEDSHIVRGEGSAVVGDDAAILAGATYKDFGALRTGGGNQPKTGYQEVDFDARADSLITSNLRLTLAHQTVRQDDAWRTHKTIFGQPFRGTTVGNEKKRALDQNRHLTYAKLEAVELPGFIEKFDLTLSHHRQGEERFRIKKDDTSDIQGFDVDTVGASLQAFSPTEVGAWVYGIEYYRDYVDSYSRKFNADGSLKSIGIQGPVADDATYDTLGIYVQNAIPLTDKLDVILGGRYNFIAADANRFEDPATGAKASFSETWDAFVGSARVLYRLIPDPNVNLFAGVSQGFRAPNLSDLTRLDTARTDELETPSPDLDPEEFTAYEIGIKGGSENVTLEVAYFYTDIQDLIVRTPTGRTIEGNKEVTKKNGGEGFVQGVELNGRVWFFEDWMLWGNLTWTDGEVDTFPTSSPEKKREPLDRVMPLTGNAGLRFQPTADYWIEGLITAADKQDDLSTRDKADTQRIPPGGTPGYVVYTVRGGWQVTKDLTLTAALENIADKDYRIHGSGLNEPGRNVVIAAEYVF